MSLVNNMLRDLDQRRRTTDLSGTTTVRLNPAVDDRSGNRKLVLGIGIVAMLAIVLSVLYFRIYQQDSATRELNLPVAATDPVEATPEPDSETVFLQQQAQQSIAQPPQVTVPQNVVANPETAASSSPQDSPVEQSDGESMPGDVNHVADAADAAEVDVEGVVSPPMPPIDMAAVVTTDSGPSDTIASVVSNAQAAVDSNPLTDVTQLREQAPVKSSSELTPQQRDAANAQQALHLYNDNRTDEAFSVLFSYITNNRDGHQSRETFAKLLIQQGAFVDAMNVMDEGLALSPNHSGFKKVKARLLISGNRTQEAVALLTTRAPALRTDVEYYELLAGAQLANEEYGNAAVTYTSLLRYDRSPGKWWYALGAAYDGAGDEAAATQAYRQALAQPNLSAGLRQQSQRRIASLSPQ
ncbi:MAG: tetratricopeptide repeat protein [Pseudohongiellaceae bacterium]